MKFREYFTEEEMTKMNSDTTDESLLTKREDCASNTENSP